MFKGVLSATFPCASLSPHLFINSCAVMLRVMGRYLYFMLYFRSGSSFHS